MIEDRAEILKLTRTVRDHAARRILSALLMLDDRHRESLAGAAEKLVRIAAMSAAAQPVIGRHPPPH